MRLISLTGDSGEEVELHPLVTVLAAAGSAAGVVRQAAQALARSEEGAGTGTLEAHGVLFPFRRDLLTLLDIEQGIDPVVTAEEVPTRPTGPASTALRAAQASLVECSSAARAAEADLAAAAQEEAAAHAALDAAERDLHEAEATQRTAVLDAIAHDLDRAAEHRRRLADELEALRPRLGEVEAVRVELEAQQGEVRERRDAAAALRAAIDHDLAEVAAVLAPEAEAEIDAAEERLRDLQAQLAADPADGASGADASAANPADGLPEVEARLEGVDRSLAALAPVDAVPVRAALRLLLGAEPAPLVPDPVAGALADELELLERRAQTEPEPLRSVVDPARARAQLEEARHALMEAEQALRGPALERAQVDRLERAHMSLLDALDRADRRFGAARAQREVQELREAEQAVLDELGFATYADYIIGSTTRTVEPLRVDAVDEAREALAIAEDTWRRLQDQTDRELARAEALDRRRVLLEQARAHLGVPVGAEDAVAALRDHRVPSVTDDAARRQLAEALGAAGLVLGDEEIDADDLGVLAEGLLEETDAAVARRARLLEEQAELLGLAAGMRGAIDAHEHPVIDPQDDEDRRTRLQEAEAALASAQHRAHAHREALPRHEELTAALAEAEAEERDARELAVEADAAVAARVADEESLREQIAAAEAELVDAERDEAETSERMRQLADEAVDPEALASELQACRQRLTSAQAALDDRRSAVDSAQRREEERTAEVERLQAEATREGGGASTVEECEWYLLARLAAQRSSSLGAGLPLVLDDALAGLELEGAIQVLERIERMAGAVQVVVITDDVGLHQWATEVGIERAALVDAG